jgi:hypothetical protein
MRGVRDNPSHMRHREAAAIVRDDNDAIELIGNS